MKKLCLILLSLVIVMSASAQRKVYYRYSRPSRVIVSYGWGYPYYYPYGWWYPYPSYYYHESKLDMQIEDIRAEYKDRIRAVRHDKSLSRSERRSKIDALRSQREEAIMDARKDYYKSR